MIFILSLSLASIFLSLIKFRIWSPAAFFSIFLFLQLLLYYLFLNNFVPDSAFEILPLPYELIGNNLKETLTFYFILLISFIIPLFFYKKKIELKKIDLDSSVLINNIPNGYLTLVSVSILLLSINYLLDMNFKNILEHSQYLDAVKPERMGLENIFSIVFHNSMLFLSVFSIFSYALCKKKNLNLEKTIFLLVSILLFFLLLGRGSRGIIFLVIFYGLCDTLILKEKISNIKLLIYILICSQLFFTVIGIRSSNYGGLFHIVPLFFNISIQNAYDSFFLIYQNTCFGVINFDISLNFEPNHSTIYKFLSNSPLLSVMDGFREISEEFIYRINVYTPFSSYVESYHFGIPFVLYFCFIQILNIYLVSSKTNTSNYLFYLPATLFSNLSIIYATQYSVRTTTKFIFLSFLFFFIANYYLKKNSKNLQIINK